MGDPKLSLPRVRVIRDGHDPLELQILNPDLIRWDLTRGKHRWPEMRQAPNVWLTFIAWAAATRTGATTDTWERFRDTTLEASTITDDEEEDEEGEPGVGDPFPEDPEPDSS